MSKKNQRWFNNWQIKLLAIVAAVFLWLYIGVTKNAGNKKTILNQKNNSIHGILKTNGK